MDLISILLFSILAIGAIFAVGVVVRGRRGPAPGFARVTLNYLIPGDDDEPLMPREVNAAGINHMGMCGVHRQKLIAKLRRGQTLYLIRMPDHPEDPNAVVLFSEDGKDIGFLTREVAEEIAPRLDAGSPVTATVGAVEPFETEHGRRLLGVRLVLVPHRMRRKRE
jgi:hypothetical protein